MGYTLGDAFAGIGGFRLAFRELGVETVWACEINDAARTTYEFNFGGRVQDWDIRRARPESIPDFDILTGGFPCQPFSNQRPTHLHPLDETALLFYQLTRIAAVKQPKVIFLENVPALLDDQRGVTFSEMLRELDFAGYPSVHWKVIDSRLVSPQIRKRLYIVAVHHTIGRGRAFQWPAMIDEGWTLGDILEPPEKVDKLRYTITPKALKGIERRASTTGWEATIVGPTDKTRTLPASYFKSRKEILVAQPGDLPRILTPREAARLMGFPDRYQLLGYDGDIYHQLGNSVVVPLIRLIGREILKCLD